MHLDRLQNRISNSAECRVPTDLQFLFICYTNRCGSNFVAELLASTGSFNLAGEFFNHDTVNNQMQRLGLNDFANYFAYLCENRSKNGRLVSKLAVAHLQVLHRAGILDQIIEKSKFVAVERNDRLMQAISLSIAAQTGQWTSYMPSRIPDENIVYSRQQLEAIIETTVQQQRIFDLFFAINGIEQHKIIYEQLVSSPDLYIASLGEWLGAKIGQVDLKKIRLQPQLSERNLEWKRRFLQE